MKSSALRAGIRDLVSLGVGTFVILHQELTGGGSWLSWSGGLILIGGPAAIGAANLIRGSVAILGTPESSSGSQRVSASSGSSSTSSGAHHDE